MTRTELQISQIVIAIRWPASQWAASLRSDQPELCQVILGSHFVGYDHHRIGRNSALLLQNLTLCPWLEER